MLSFTQYARRQILAKLIVCCLQGFCVGGGASLYRGRDDLSSKHARLLWGRGHSQLCGWVPKPHLDGRHLTAPATHDSEMLLAESYFLKSDQHSLEY